jgi:hypothetical protein
MNGPWHPDGKGILPGGDVGDIQAGDSYSVRFVRDDMPGSLITVKVYAVEPHFVGVPGPQGAGAEYAWQEQVEFMVCEDPADPGGTETWSDVEYEDSDLVYETLAEADRAARSVAEGELRHHAATQEWDGKPDYERRG